MVELPLPRLCGFYWVGIGRLTLQTLLKRSLAEMADLLPGLEAKVSYNSFEELLELEKQSARD